MRIHLYYYYYYIDNLQFALNLSRKITFTANRLQLILLFLSAFSLACLGNQDASDILKTSILRQNLSNKNLHLDPLLRKALLRALVELEKEAEEKLRAEESRDIRSEPRNLVGNYVERIEERKEEIQQPAESSAFSSSLINDLSAPSHEVNNGNDADAPVENTTPIPQNTFQYSTSLPLQEERSANLGQESKGSDSTSNPSSIESNFIPNDGSKEQNANNENESSTENQKEIQKEDGKSSNTANEVELFKAPLLTAFTLHQDSKGTPHSVIPLLTKEQQNLQQRQQQLLEQQYALLKQQQLLQNQFIPGVSLTPLAAVNQFDQSRFFFPGTVGTAFTSAPVFPPLVSNSILQQSFTPIPSQSFHSPTTAAPFKGTHQNFLTTLPPQRISPESFAQNLLPPQDFNGVNVVQSHSINLTPTPAQSFPVQSVTPAPGLQSLNIPPVTLPLQNEGRFQTPIIVPSLETNPNPVFLNNQEQERIRTRLLLEEQNRNRLIEEQRQRHIQEQNRQRQLEEERQRQIYETQLRLRQQRQENGVDFQRSVGFTFNHNGPSNFRPPARAPNNFNYHIQPSQNFVSPVTFRNSGNQHRVNRQEGLGSTGNFGFNNQGNKNFDNRNHFQSNQIYTRLPEYRTIPDEHYRNTPISNQFQQGNRYSQFGPQQTNTYTVNNAENVNKKLQSLLYQSGVTGSGSGQEDLNIVSKVLALNHERSDPDVKDTVLRNERRKRKSLTIENINDQKK
ncbi:conserved hypothetical protein [Pediculus humanus corporis]|uniref:Uncharacterized protein n=1 Tax=Pediculus humanus subsp. corporis TaxID=121224 RepID=E0VAM0_PEDHC|nr:uncharacterized protein Phum_PHUM040990 [Pediculus humanus corporis]EEB10426.1 conserved hypothetical protein [Pediculus humanus corporis]